MSSARLPFFLLSRRSSGSQKFLCFLLDIPPGSTHRKSVACKELQPK